MSGGQIPERELPGQRLFQHLAHTDSALTLTGFLLSMQVQPLCQLLPLSITQELRDAQRLEG